jgi:cobalt-zinc-cadmium efflux system protein
MAHPHHHPIPEEGPCGHGEVRAGERRRLLWVIALTAVTMVAEFAGGLLTHSLALLGDAFHMLTHLLALSLSYGAIVLAARPAPSDKTWRWWRVEILASFVNGLALLPAAGYVLYEAYTRWRQPVEIKIGPMLAVGAIGLLVNLVSAALLHAHSRHDLNVRGAFLHMLADTASSVGVMAAGIVVATTGWRQADPLAATLICAIILVWCVSLLRESVHILLESAPRHVELEKVRADMRGLEGVEEVHDLHVWTITSRMIALTAHVRLKADLKVSETEELGRRLQRLLEERHGINHPTLQFEVTDGREPCCDHEHRPQAG